MISGTTRRAVSADPISVLLYGAAALAIVAIATITRIVETFRPDGIAWVIPIDEQTITAVTGPSTVDATAQEALIVASGVALPAMAAIVAAIAAWAAAAMIVIGCVLFVAWAFLRGRFFAPGSARALDIIGWTLIATPIVILLLERVGQNGVLAAAGAGEGEPVHPIEFLTILPIAAIGLAVGLIAHAFRRGARLQRETAGLV